MKTKGPFGLRWSRLREWRAAVARSPSIGLREWLAMGALLIHALRQPGGPETRKRIRRDWRDCVRCPFHDPVFHRCIGCGCAMAYKIAAGGKCWAREQDPNSTMGFPRVAAHESSAANPCPSGDEAASG
jgi:hypothetical protein